MAQKGNFAPEEPFRKGVAITPNDVTVITETDAIYIGGAGAIVVTMAGTDVAFAAVPVGTILRVAATKIKSTGTTATSIVALYW